MTNTKKLALHSVLIALALALGYLLARVGDYNNVISVFKLLERRFERLYEMVG